LSVSTLVKKVCSRDKWPIVRATNIHLITLDENRNEKEQQKVRRETHTHTHTHRERERERGGRDLSRKEKDDRTEHTS